ncbi:transposase [Acetobacter fallax]|uniref:transposase n=1 Tax=Acetobacter fallax TaxID=1737473 RepID=UPI0038D1F5A8
MRGQNSGLNSKLHTVCDNQGRPVRLHLTAGQISDFRGADVPLADLPDETEDVIGDRGYDSNSSGPERVSRSLCLMIRDAYHHDQAFHQ